MDHEVPEGFEPLDRATDPFAEEAPNGELSATYLPYGDDRLWVGMPAEGVQKEPRRTRERAARTPRRPALSARIARFRVALPKPQLPKRLRGALAAAVVIVPASAFALISSGGEPAGIPIATGPPSPSQVFLVLDIEGLRADRVSPKRVALVWDVPASDPSEEFAYTVYRDGKVVGEVSDPAYVDERVRPKTYYYYAVTATGSAGTTATSLQLLVAVPSETGELPTEPPPAPPPPPPAPIPSPSPSPSPTSKPSTSPKPSNSFNPSFSLPPPTSTSASPTSSSPSPSPSPSPTDTASPSPTGTVSPSPTDTASPSPTDTVSPSPTDTASPTADPTV